MNNMKNGSILSQSREPFGGDINVNVDLSNYATKNDLRSATGIDTSKLALKSNLANLKAEIDKIDIEQLKHLSC